MTTADRVHSCIAALRERRRHSDPLDVDDEGMPETGDLVDAITLSFDSGDLYRNLNTGEPLPSSSAVIVALLNKVPMQIEPCGRVQN